MLHRSFAHCRRWGRHPHPNSPEDKQVRSTDFPHRFHRKSFEKSAGKIWQVSNCNVLKADCSVLFMIFMIWLAWLAAAELPPLASHDSWSCPTSSDWAVTHRELSPLIASQIHANPMKGLNSSNSNSWKNRSPTTIQRRENSRKQDKISRNLQLLPGLHLRLSVVDWVGGIRLLAQAPRGIQNHQGPHHKFGTCSWRWHSSPTPGRKYPPRQR